MTDISHRKSLLCNFYENKALDSWNHNLITEGCDRAHHKGYVLSSGACRKAVFIPGHCSTCTVVLGGRFGRKELHMPWTTTHLWSFLWIFTGSLLVRIYLKDTCIGKYRWWTYMFFLFCQMPNTLPLELGYWIVPSKKTILGNTVIIFYYQCHSNSMIVQVKKMSISLIQFYSAKGRIFSHFSPDLFWTLFPVGKETVTREQISTPAPDSAATFHDLPGELA